MADFRMLDQLQNIRKKVSGLYEVPVGERFRALLELTRLCDAAIDLDLAMQRESLGLDQCPAEANAGSWEEYQHIKAQHLKAV